MPSPVFRFPESRSRGPAFFTISPPYQYNLRSKVELAQINATVGDLANNGARLVDAARLAYVQRAQLVLTTELGLCGYPPEHLPLRPAFLQAFSERLLDCTRALADLPGLFVVVGRPHRFGKRCDVRSNSVSVPQRYDAASVLSEGRVIATYSKRELPNYQVFEERRYFASGRNAGRVLSSSRCRG